jgi:two-component system sensor kinase FixL
VEHISGKPAAVPTTDALFHALIGATADGVVVIDSSGRIQVFNAACEALFQYRQDEVIGHNATILMPEPYSSEYHGYLSDQRRTGERKIIGIGREVVGQRKDKSTFPMYLSVGETYLDGERFFVSIVRDLTVLKAEIALREGADRLLAQIVQSSNDAILSKTLDGRIISWNAAAERIFGYTAAEAIGQSVALLIPPDRLAEEDAIIAQLRAGSSIDQLQTVRRCKDGRQIDVSLSVSPVRDADGRIFAASKTVRDISEQKQADARLQLLQAELVHVARLSSMGELSSAIAHELNQPLTAATNFIEASKRTLDGPGDGAVPRARDLLDRAAGQVLRAGAIIRNLRDFVEKRDTNRSVEDIADVIAEAVALAAVGSAAGGAHVRLDFSHGLPPLLIDKIQIQQVVLNLVRNAIEAMQLSAVRDVTVGTRRDGDNVCVTVRDTGPGLQPDVLAQLFQPFVTTKEKGMGIGLAISKSIVEAHRGRILVDSRPGEGACFTVCLPLPDAVTP